MKGYDGSKNLTLEDTTNSYRSMQLNLHGFLTECLNMQKEFENLREKSEGFFIFGKQFVAESAIGIVEILDKIVFYINTLSDGNDIDLFIKLDKLKADINKCFETNKLVQKTDINENNIQDEEDEVLCMLKRIIGHTSQIHLSNIPNEEMNVGECTSAHDILLYCYRKVFNVLNSKFNNIREAGHNTLESNKGIYEIAINWLDNIEQSNSDNTLSEVKDPIANSQNPGVLELIDGINEVLKSDSDTPESEDSGGNCNKGLIFHSPNTITFYYLSPQYELVLASNLCDAASGNYIFLLINLPEALHGDSPYNLLIGKLLHWLDFVNFNSRNTIISSIKSITSNQLKGHLNMVGKLLSFISAPRIPLLNDSDVQNELELFLETIV